MANLEDIERARLGKETWNAWAEDNPGAGVDFSGDFLTPADFAGFVFPGEADFTSATLHGKLSFKDAKFCDTSKFHNTEFMGYADFGGAKFEGHAIFNGAIFHGGIVFTKTQFERDAEFSRIESCFFADFHLARFMGNANFNDSKFSVGPTIFNGAVFGASADFTRASFADNFVGFSTTQFGERANFSFADFADDAKFQNALFSGEVNFWSAKFHGLGAFNDARFTTIAIFRDSTFEAVPTFHGAQLHQDTTFEAVTWPDRAHEGQSPYDAARAWAWLRVEMNRLHKHEDELLFFTRELNSRAYDTRNEPLTKRLLYRLFLALGSGRSVAVPLSWLLGLNAFLFLPIYWFATSVIQGRKLWSWDIPADVVSFTLGHALPFIGASNPERPDLYRRLFAPADCGGIDVPLWLESVGALQELTGVALVFLIVLALRNRFRMK